MSDHLNLVKLFAKSFLSGWRSTGADLGTFRAGLFTLASLPFLLVSGIVSLFRDEEKERVRKEQAETRALWNEVSALYDASPLAPLSSVDVIADTVREALQAANCVELPSGRVIKALIDTTEALLISEGITSLPEINWSRPLGLEEGVRMRNDLRKQKSFLGDAAYNLALWQKTIGAACREFISTLPETACIDDEEPAPFTAPLIDLIPNPAEVIEGVILAFFDQPVISAGLFTELRERLNENLHSVSAPRSKQRVEPERLVLPTSASGSVPNELVRDYLNGTPLGSLFDTTIPFFLPDESRFEHCHIVGGTGHGKTQTLQSLIYDDLQRAKAGHCSVVVIDSQGDLIRTILHLAEFSPTNSESLADRLLLIDPNDIEYPVCLNMFDMNKERIAGYEPVDREKILNGAIELYEYIFGALLGAELTQKQGVIFRYLARLMLVIPNATVQTLVALMEDGKPFKPYMEELGGTSRKFFETQFFHPSFNATKSQILKRLWGVLANTTFERMFSHVENKVDIFGAINEGKIILINTAKDLLRQEGSEIFGRFFIAMIAQAALERATIPAEKRLPTFIYIDEAHEYFDETVELLLGQARKYKIGITMAHQTLDQASAGLRASMMSNTSIKFAGGVSNKDARAFAAEMRCDADFIHGTRKRKTETEFACFVKHVTEQAIKVSVPLGRVEALPRISDEDFATLIDKNRGRYAAPAPELEPWQFEAPPVPVVTDTEAEPLPDTPPPESAPIKRRKRPTHEQADVPPPMGDGGADHKYLQNLVKLFAEERGYRAMIEKHILDGSGRVDVSLTKGDERIACEISISTTPEHELANIRKCLSARYDAVLVVCKAPKHLNDIRKCAEDQLATDEFERVSFLLPDHVMSHLDERDAVSENREDTIRGIKVKVTHTPVDPDEALRKRAQVAKVIAGTIRQLEDS